jgi:uncharacterized protein (DUF1330 family)
MISNILFSKTRQATPLMLASPSLDRVMPDVGKLRQPWPLVPSRLGKHPRFAERRSAHNWRHAAAKGRTSMPAYLIAEHIITDAKKFEEYRTKVGPMIAKHGGRYLTKGGSHKMPEGGHWKPERVVIVEFPDMRALNAWYTSTEYQPLIALRKQCTSDLDMLFTLEGA